MKKICITKNNLYLTKNKIYELKPHEISKDKYTFIDDLGEERVINSLSLPTIFSNITLSQAFQESDSMEDIGFRNQKDKKTLENISQFVNWENGNEAIRIKRENPTVWNDFIENRANNLKPSYYNQEGITPFDYIKSNNLNFFEGNVIKYITRYKEKNGIEDLKKAEIYLKELIKNYE